MYIGEKMRRLINNKKAQLKGIVISLIFILVCIVVLMNSGKSVGSAQDKFADNAETLAYANCPTESKQYIILPNVKHKFIDCMRKIESDQEIKYSGYYDDQFLFDKQWISIADATLLLII